MFQYMDYILSKIVRYETIDEPKICKIAECAVIKDAAAPVAICQPSVKSRTKVMKMTWQTEPSAQKFDCGPAS